MSSSNTKKKLPSTTGLPGSKPDRVKTAVLDTADKEKTLAGSIDIVTGANRSTAVIAQIML